MKPSHQILSLSAALGAGLLAVSAFAQQPASPTPPPPAQTAPQAEAGRQRGPSSEDRIAFFEAHLASVRAGLRLTPDQERLWPPVESAVRDMSRQMMELREQRQSQAAPADPVERMARMGEMSTKRGQAMSRLAEAARPLYASLSDDQKRRLRTLMRAPGGEDRRGGMRMDRDEAGGRHGRHHHDGMAGGGGMYGHGRHGDMRGEGRGMRGGEERGYGGWNDWR